MRLLGEEALARLPTVVEGQVETPLRPGPRLRGHPGAPGLRGEHREVGGHPPGGRQVPPARGQRRQDPHPEGRVQAGQASRALLQEAAAEYQRQLRHPGGPDARYWRVSHQGSGGSQGQKRNK